MSSTEARMIPFPATAFNTSNPAKGVASTSAAANTDEMALFKIIPDGYAPDDRAPLLKAGFKLPDDKSFQNVVLAPMSSKAAAPCGPAFSAVYFSVSKQTIPVPSTTFWANMPPTTLAFGVISQQSAPNAAFWHATRDGS